MMSTHHDDVVSVFWAGGDLMLNLLLVSGGLLSKDNDFVSVISRLV